MLFQEEYDYNCRFLAIVLYNYTLNFYLKKILGFIKVKTHCIKISRNQMWGCHRQSRNKYAACKGDAKSRQQTLSIVITAQDEAIGSFG